VIAAIIHQKIQWLKKMNQQQEEKIEKKNSIFRVLVARVRHQTHAELKHIADTETDRTGRQIYVADIVREAIRNHIRNHRSHKINLDGLES
jgi:hypothetical protein